MFGYVFSVWEREQEFMTSSVQIPHICGGHAWLINSQRFRSEPIMRSWTEIFAGIATKSNMKTLPSCDGYFKSRATRVFHPHSYTRRPAISNAVTSLIFHHYGPGSILNSTRVDVDWICWFSAPAREGFTLALPQCCFPPPPKLTFDWNVNEIVVINRVDDACKPP